jgi:hypothetical protein
MMTAEQQQQQVFPSFATPFTSRHRQCTCLSTIIVSVVNGFHTCPQDKQTSKKHMKMYVSTKSGPVFFAAP